MTVLTVEAYITPKIIEWARKRSNYSISMLAQKISTEPKKIDAWERGLENPSFHQAEELARALSIPFGYLYLSKPPEESFPLPDLRTIKRKYQSRPSPDFLDTIYDAMRKQDWYRQIQENRKAESLSFIGKFSLEATPESVAKDINKTLSIDNEMRKKARNWEQFLADFIHHAESKGIIVLRQGIVGNNNYRKLNVDEFRGFAITDNVAPLVFINDQDFKVAKIFTLAHELAHLWIGQSGISNLDYFLRSSEQKNKIDGICDNIAAEVLTPANDFLSTWGYESSIESNIDHMVRQYRVSRFVILRRAFDLGLISHDVYKQYYTIFRLDKKSPKVGKEVGFTRLFLNRNSQLFTFALLSSAKEGRVSYLKAAHLLNIKLRSLVSIQDRLL